MIPEHLVPDFDPLANPEAVVFVHNLRVSVISPRLLRIEYSPTNQFEDRPSQTAWFRNHPSPDFTTSIRTQIHHGDRNKQLVLSTSELTLKFTIGKPLSSETLSIQFKSNGTIWHFGDKDPGNLGGTFRTLDNRNGQVNLEPGLISRSGWSVIDDTNTLVFNDDGWLEPRNAHPNAKDLYFFGFGDNFQDCINTYRKMTGPVPLLPRWVLGNWWSRYWRYNQNQIISLIQEFQDNEVPLSVLIIDMDWHITDTGNDSSGWTGYTWNRKLFPDPTTLIRHIHERGLKTALNLHPADGIHSHEAQYQDFAIRMGINPDSGDPIPFDLADPFFFIGIF